MCSIVSTHSSTISRTISRLGRTLSMRLTIWPTGLPESARLRARTKRVAISA